MVDKIKAFNTSGAKENGKELRTVRVITIGKCQKVASIENTFIKGRNLLVNFVTLKKKL